MTERRSSAITTSLYLYHNRIDAIGDKLATEERLPEAAEDAIEDLTKLVRSSPLRISRTS